MMAHPGPSLLIALLLAVMPAAASPQGACDMAEISPAALAERMDAGAELLLLDMRKSTLFLAGTLGGALNIAQLDEIRADDSHRDVDDRPVVILTETGRPDADLRAWVEWLCASGVAVALLAGGIAGWRAAGLPLEDPGQRLTTPGAVPFVIPRGLCEMNDPAQQYD